MKEYAGRPSRSHAHRRPWRRRMAVRRAGSSLARDGGGARAVPSAESAVIATSTGCGDARQGSMSMRAILRPGGRRRPGGRSAHMRRVPMPISRSVLSTARAPAVSGRDGGTTTQALDPSKRDTRAAIFSASARISGPHRPRSRLPDHRRPWPPSTSLSQRRDLLRIGQRVGALAERLYRRDVGRWPETCPTASRRRPGGAAGRHMPERRAMTCALRWMLDALGANLQQLFSVAIWYGISCQRPRTRTIMASALAGDAHPPARDAPTRVVSAHFFFSVLTAGDRHHGEGRGLPVGLGISPAQCRRGLLVAGVQHPPAVGVARKASNRPYILHARKAEDRVRCPAGASNESTVASPPVMRGMVVFSVPASRLATGRGCRYACYRVA